jgi:NADPH:quinone reductase-like Zn-dependent oxidoreductase
VGCAAVQLGHAAGARVTATVRNSDHHDAVGAFGADVYAPDDFIEQGPYDVVLELVGAINLMDNLKALNTGGRIAVIGTGAGATGEINLGLLMMKRARMHGSTLRARPLELKALTARAMERSVLPLLASGAVKVPVAKTYPLAEAPDAYEHFKRGGKLGKIVLTMD